MYQYARRARSILAKIACVTSVLVLGACARQTSMVHERLDDATGTTVRVEGEPTAFARTETRYSRSGRDYLYLGPVQTNRQGVREYYLWIGVATTLDRGYLAPPSGEPEKVFVDVAGEPMELALHRWQERDAGLRDARVYGTPVRLGAELAARITLDQLRRLASESPQSLRVVDRNGNERAYYRWHEGGDWSKFLAAVGHAE